MRLSNTLHLRYLERDISAENLVDIKQKVQDKYRCNFETRIKDLYQQAKYLQVLRQQAQSSSCPCARGLWQGLVRCLNISIDFQKHLFYTLQLSLRLQVAVHRKQLLKVKFGLKVKIFSQWFESIIQLNLCHRAEIRHGRSAEQSWVILNICHLPSVQCFGDYFRGWLGPLVGGIQNLFPG